MNLPKNIKKICPEEQFVYAHNSKNYLVSSFGRVYSMKRKTFLKPYRINRGFRQVSIDNRTKMVHILMIESFTGQTPNRTWFENKDKDDLRLSNLRWNV